MDARDPVELDLPGPVSDTLKLREYLARMDITHPAIAECAAALAAILAMKLEDAAVGNPPPDEANFDQERTQESVRLLAHVNRHFNG